MENKTFTVDVIIPLYKPGKELFELLEKLSGQTIAVGRIILMNTEEKYFEQLTYGTDFDDRFKHIVTVYHLSKREFDHGRTRRFGVEKSQADYFVMMTQDAMPANEKMLENLLEPFKDDKVAVSYARQMPAKDCRVIENYTRSFNYPDESRIKAQSDLETLGIKTYFCSNVCAAYRRSTYNELGGFVKRTIFNEDMIYAAGAIKAGYKVAYRAEAEVVHSHNYTNKQQFKRNFDLGVSQAEHPEVFKNVPSEKEGKKLVSSTLKYLWKDKKKKWIPYFCMQCVSKYAGYLLGKNYRKLPRAFVMKCTSNKQYWQ